MIAPRRACPSTGRFVQFLARTCPSPLLLVVLLALCSALVPTRVQAAPQIWLPTPPGEPWRIVQGYGCGSHNGYDRYSLDIVSERGETRGAPAFAAADGTVWSIVAGSGTVIIDHGDGYRTMYTHLQRFAVSHGQRVARGAVVGQVGNVGAPGVVPHLHFTMFRASGRSSLGTSVPLAFADGPTLRDLGGCNQHGETTVIARNGMADEAAPTINFASSLVPERWYNQDERITFTINDDVAVRGFSQRWNEAPAEDEPMFVGTREGYVQLAWAGEGLHKIVVRAWDASGKQTTAEFGPVGYDTGAPGPAGPLSEAAAAAAAQPGAEPITLAWNAATDVGGAGVIGYRMYLGADAEGTSDWFGPGASVTFDPPQASAFFRVQAVDAAGNAGPWTTLAQLNPPST